MRRGILSLMGRGKASARKKTTNMGIAEQAAEKRAPAEEAKVEVKAQEKPFVQTIMVPKRRPLMRITKRKRGGTAAKSHRKPQGGN